jgi:hypothetical protein
VTLAFVWSGVCTLPVWRALLAARLPRLAPARTR